MSMAVINWVKVLHLLAVATAVSGALAQLFILSKSRRAGATEAEAGEKMASSIFRGLAFPGVMVALVLGLILAGVMGKFAESWLHAKMTLVLNWVVLAHMQLRGMKRMLALRAAGDMAKKKKTKSVQINISRVVAVLVLVIFYLAVFRLDAF